MALMLGMFASAAVFGSVFGGINAAKQQEQIKKSVCQVAKQMQQYKQNIETTDNLLDKANDEIQNEITGLNVSIGTYVDDIRIQHSTFKKTYNRWVVGSIIFLMMLIFLFATKKFILGASTEKN